MNASEFRDALAELGHPQIGFAKLVGTNDRTVRRWAADEQPIPPWVPLMLKLLLKTRVPA